MAKRKRDDKELAAREQAARQKEEEEAERMSAFVERAMLKKYPFKNGPELLEGAREAVAWVAARE